MMRYITLLLVGMWASQLSAQSPSLEQRVVLLEKEVAALREENRKLRESAVEFLAAELAAKEKERARFIYRTQVLPMVKTMLEDFGSEPPRLPKENEINTMIEAYRPFVELMLSLGKVADVK